MDESWTLQELVTEVANRLGALPEPRNGQVRAVPDDRTVRYYGTIGLLGRPSAMRGRTALYDRRHLAQVVAIKRLQAMGRSLAEIQALWPTLDDSTLARMTGVTLAPRPTTARSEFWKREPARERAAAAPAAP
ncbi:MAG: MerR family transcriptional regulator, partial [Myxococcota bacterium]|nr:MerR family transcriptional regulator [Myxococcota bacterium]